MSVENAQYINELNNTLPRAKDLINEGDDHIRLVKKSIQNTFSMIKGKVTISDTKLNKIDSSIETDGEALLFKSSVKMAENKTIDAGGNRIIKVGDPVDETDAVSLKYAKANIMAAIWPVGAIFMTVDSKDPKDILGFGKWDRFSAGRTLVGAGSSKDTIGVSKSFTAGDIGGNYSHLITVQELPSHTHSLTNVKTSPGGEHKHDSGVAIRASNEQPFGVAKVHEELPSYEHHKYGESVGTPWTDTAPGHTHDFTGDVGATGNNQAMDMLQPYVVINMWKRVE